jgi:hypothetical protein
MSCRHERQTMKLNVIITLFVAVTLLLVVAGCTSNDAPAPVTPEKTLTPLTKVTARTTVKTPVPVAQDFTISDVENKVTGSGQFQIHTITGRVQNNQDRTVSLIMVQADYFDKDKIKLGHSMGIIDDLEPGQIGMFKIVMFDQDVINNCDNFNVFIE